MQLIKSLKKAIDNNDSFSFRMIYTQLNNLGMSQADIKKELKKVQKTNKTK